MSKPEPALTINEFARRNAISRATVNRLIERGELRSYRIGSQVRIPADVADAIQNPDAR